MFAPNDFINSAKIYPQGLFLPSFHLERSQFVKSQNNIRPRGKMGKGLSDPKYLLFLLYYSFYSTFRTTYQLLSSVLF